MKEKNPLNHIKGKKINIKKIINRNELTVLVIALMLVTAGYLDYIGKIKDEEVVSVDIEEQIEETPKKEEDIAKIGDATLVNADIDNSLEIANDIESNKNINKEEEDNSYFVSSKLERSNMYSQIIENYKKIIENVNISEEQKAIASQEISKINNIQNSIMISENLLLAKGFDKCVIFVNDKSISVIIGKEEIKPEELAQIQNIVSRELNSNIENIHISTK